MSILINDMEMPKERESFTVTIKYNGLVFDTETMIQVAEAQEVPPHYDLIDHNALKIAVMNGDCETRVDFLKHTMDCINKAPVVIPSDMPTYKNEECE